MTISASSEHRVNSDSDLSGETRGSIVIEGQSTVTLSGTHVGSVEIQGGSALVVRGSVEGPVDVASLATLDIVGSINGALTVKVAGTVVIAPEGSLKGAITNYGSITNNGVRSGTVTGRVPDDQAGSTVDTSPFFRS